MELQTTLILNCMALVVFTTLLTGQLTRSAQHTKQLSTILVVTLAIACVAGAFYVFGGRYSPALICLIVIVVSGYRLYKPHGNLILAASLGFLIVSIIGVLAFYGLPALISLLLAFGILFLTVFAVRNQHFIYSEQIHEDALLIVLLAALLILVIPPIEQGWQSARVLNMDFEVGSSASENRATTDIRFYGLLLSALCAGIGFSLLKRN